MNFDCIQYIYDPSTKEDESEMHSIGIYLRTPTTQKVHAGASIFVHRATKQKRLTSITEAFSQCKQGPRIPEANEQHNGIGLRLPSRL